MLQHDPLAHTPERETAQAEEARPKECHTGGRSADAAIAALIEL
jgi:hypothetical protein